MKDFLYILLIIAVGFVIGLSTERAVQRNLSETQSTKCIEKYLVWDFETHRQKEVWRIEGTRYLVQEGPQGGKEIVGKLSRFTNNHKRITTN